MVIRKFYAKDEDVKLNLRKINRVFEKKLDENTVLYKFNPSFFGIEIKLFVTPKGYLKKIDFDEQNGDSWFYGEKFAIALLCCIVEGKIVLKFFEFNVEKKRRDVKYYKIAPYSILMSTPQTDTFFTANEEEYRKYREENKRVTKMLLKRYYIAAIKKSLLECLGPKLFVDAYHFYKDLFKKLTGRLAYAEN